MIQNKTQVETVNFRLHSVWRWLWNKVENLQSQPASCFESYFEFSRCLVFSEFVFYSKIMLIPAALATIRIIQLSILKLKCFQTKKRTKQISDLPLWQKIFSNRRIYRHAWSVKISISARLSPRKKSFRHKIKLFSVGNKP